MKAGLQYGTEFWLSPPLHLLFYQKNLTKTPFHFLNSYYIARLLSCYSNGIAKRVQIKPNISSAKLVLLIDKKMPIGVGKKVLTDN